MSLKYSLCLLVATMSVANAHAGTLELEVLGTYDSGIFDESAAEIGAYDAINERFFVTNAGDSTIDVLDVSDPKKPTLAFTIDVTPWGSGANSIDIHGNVLVAAVQANTKTDKGKAVFFNTNGKFLSAVTVGHLPDMVTFDRWGLWAVVANEGEPNDAYTTDPVGSISVINVFRRHGKIKQSDVTDVGFGSLRAKDLDPSVMIYGPGASIAQDLEPEYVSISGFTAYVTLQENNAVAKVDLLRKRLVDVIGLGLKDHSKSGNGFDASDKDGNINITTHPTLGLYQPDSIATYWVGRSPYFVVVNEGDNRDYAGYSEEVRVKDLVLDPGAFPDAKTLQSDANLGRLKVTNAIGDIDGDGDFDELYSNGARSFSIYTSSGTQVYDSGDDLEQLIKKELPSEFNSTNDENGSFDGRSTSKGPEPEALIVKYIDCVPYAFIGLERIGGIAIFDISDPKAPSFVSYTNNRDFTGDAELGTAGDLGPESMEYVSASDSPNGKPMLIVPNEVSGTTTLYEVVKAGH